MTADANRARGQYGEDRAAQWYLDSGYDILDRNWRNSSGELDLVARLGDTIVFVEVKARASLAFGSPFEAITVAKQRRIRGLAADWMRASEHTAALLRFDAVAVIGTDVEVLLAAF